MYYQEKKEYIEEQNSNTSEEINQKPLKQPIKKVPCNYCDASGVVSMIDEGEYSYSFNCICKNANKTLKIPIWNGKKNTIYKK